MSARCHMPYTHGESSTAHHMRWSWCILLSDSAVISQRLNVEQLLIEPLQPPLKVSHVRARGQFLRNNAEGSSGRNYYGNNLEVSLSLKRLHQRRGQSLQPLTVGVFREIFEWGLVGN